MTGCGLDFGTSNSAIGVADGDGARLVPIEGGRTLMPTAVFFDFTVRNRIVVGREGIEAYVDGIEGRLMRALKTILGSPLIDEQTNVKFRKIALADVVAHYVAEMKTRAEAACGHTLESVVHGRPVHFVDGDDKADARAEGVLAKIAEHAGFKHVSFEFEPIAAALDYEAKLAREELVLVADIGGGTSDFTVIRLGPERRQRNDRKADILATAGIRSGGTDYDRLLSIACVMPLFGYGAMLSKRHLPMPKSYFHELAHWPTINGLYTARTRQDVRELHIESTEPAKTARLLRTIQKHLGHRVAFAVEDGKIALTAAEETRIALDVVEPGLAAPATRAEFDRAIGDELLRIRACIADCLKRAKVAATKIDTVFLTGGSSLVPAIRASIAAETPAARIATGDDFLSVAMGLTIEAGRRYR